MPVPMPPAPDVTKPCPPGTYRNQFTGDCEPMNESPTAEPTLPPPTSGQDLRLGNGRFNVTCRYQDGKPALAWKLPGLDGGYFTFFSPNNPEIWVKYADLTSMPGGQHGLSFSKSTTVGFSLAVTDLVTKKVQVVRDTDIGEPAWTWFAP